MTTQRSTFVCFWIALCALWLLPIESLEAKCFWKTKKVSVLLKFDCRHKVVKAEGFNGVHTVRVHAEGLQCGTWSKDFHEELFRKAHNDCASNSTNKTQHNFEARVTPKLRYKNIVDVAIHRSSYTGGAHPVDSHQRKMFDIATGKPLTLARLFPKKHRHIKRQLHLAFRKLPRSKRMGFGCSSTNVTLMKKNKRLFAQMHCGGTVEALRNSQVTVTVPVNPTDSEELWPKRRTARSLQDHEWKKLKLVMKGKGQVIRKHSLKINLPGYRNHFFVASEQTQQGKQQAHFYLVANSKVVYTFPKFRGNAWQVHEIAAVALRDLDRDGKRDLLVMVDCMTGVGPQGARPFRVTTTYFRNGKVFATFHPWEKILEKQGPTTIRKVGRLARKHRGMLRKRATK